MNIYTQYSGSTTLAHGILVHTLSIFSSHDSIESLSLDMNFQIVNIYRQYSGSASLAHIILVQTLSVSLVMIL